MIKILKKTQCTCKVHFFAPMSRCILIFPPLSSYVSVKDRFWNCLTPKGKHTRISGKHKGRIAGFLSYTKEKNDFPYKKHGRFKKMSIRAQILFCKEYFRKKHGALLKNYVRDNFLRSFNQKMWNKNRKAYYKMLLNIYDEQDQLLKGAINGKQFNLFYFYASEYSLCDSFLMQIWCHCTHEEYRYLSNVEKYLHLLQHELEWHQISEDFLAPLYDSFLAEKIAKHQPEPRLPLSIYEKREMIYRLSEDNNTVYSFIVQLWNNKSPIPPFDFYFSTKTLPTSKDDVPKDDVVT